MPQNVIEKCTGKGCPIKENCYLYTTNKTTEFVVTFHFDKEKNNCDNFVSNLKNFTPGL